MALIRWQPFQELEILRRQMDQIFDELSKDELPTTRDRNNGNTWKPAVELQDTEDSIILRAEIPGVEAKDIDIQVTSEAVAITGEHRYEQKAEERGYFRSEFRYGKFHRVIALPVPIQNHQVKADFNHGIVTLTLPKLTEARRTVVKINLADNNTASPELTGNSNGEANNSEPAIS